MDTVTIAPRPTVPFHSACLEPWDHHCPPKVNSPGADSPAYNEAPRPNLDTAGLGPPSRGGIYNKAAVPTMLRRCNLSRIVPHLVAAASRAWDISLIRSSESSHPTLNLMKPSDIGSPPQRARRSAVV
jgi:hypothetical protein